MRRPMPTIAVMFGMPSPLAHEPQDEDSLDRERGNDRHHGNSDAAEIISSIVRELHHRGPGAARDVRALAGCLDELAACFMKHDAQGIEEAADRAYDELKLLIEE